MALQNNQRQRAIFWGWRLNTRLMRAILAMPFGLSVISCADEVPPPPPAVEVSVIRIDGTTQPLELAYSARTRGTREVEVRARVSGILERRYYREGEMVSAGDRLFRIDPAPFAAAARSAQGQLGIHVARLKETERQLARVKALHARGFVSGRSLDQAESDHATAMSAAAASRGELDRAQLYLAYTEVRAPISGVTGLESRSEGSLVDAESSDSSLLTTITQTDSLYIDFAMPEPEAQSVRAAMNGGGVTARLRSAGSDTVLGTAKITFIDTRVNVDTGTVDVRATLRNEGGRISPGQFVRVELLGLAARAGTYVPARAVSHGAEGPFVWKIDKRNRARMQPVTIDAPVGNFMRIAKGVVSGDRIVIDGILKLQPGAAVHAVPAIVHR